MAHILTAGAVQFSVLAITVRADQLPGQRRAQLLHPGDEAGLEALCIERREHPAEGVVRSDAIAEGQEASKPVELEVRLLHDVDPVLRAADDGTQCHQQQLVERVGAVATAQVGRVREGLQDLGAATFIFCIHQSASSL